MKLCTKHGCGVCVNCPRNLPNSWGDICRYDAEEMLDVLNALLKTKFSQEQKDIMLDFGFIIYDTE